MRREMLAATICILMVLLPPAAAQVAGSTKKAAADPAMFGQTPSRNMVSAATGLPATWDSETGTNIKWSEALGSQTYGGPIVSNGVVYVGTNNEGLRNPRHEGDRGTVMAFKA